MPRIPTVNAAFAGIVACFLVAISCRGSRKVVEHSVENETAPLPNCCTCCTRGAKVPCQACARLDGSAVKCDLSAPNAFTHYWGQVFQECAASASIQANEARCESFCRPDYTGVCRPTLATNKLRQAASVIVMHTENFCSLSCTAVLTGDDSHRCARVIPKIGDDVSVKIGNNMFLGVLSETQRDGKFKVTIRTLVQGVHPLTSGLPRSLATSTQLMVEAKKGSQILYIGDVVKKGMLLFDAVVNQHGYKLPVWTVKIDDETVGAIQMSPSQTSFFMVLSQALKKDHKQGALVTFLFRVQDYVRYEWESGKLALATIAKINLDGSADVYFVSDRDFDVKLRTVRHKLNVPYDVSIASEQSEPIFTAPPLLAPDLKVGQQFFFTKSKPKPTGQCVLMWGSKEEWGSSESMLKVIHALKELEKKHIECAVVDTWFGTLSSLGTPNKPLRQKLVALSGLNSEDPQFFLKTDGADLQFRKSTADDDMSVVYGQRAVASEDGEFKFVFGYEDFKEAAREDKLCESLPCK
eukprot:TRINITY_DN22372_c0_g2_i1.p1 TRINITY_DN22372_c0_g2~~TRINITY_DN22372_c0_g2_i1.p1  ORF type:complete len:524 (+),score=44.25 TRINITY_DN22372_c0_g2_i1:65-1636(+)